LTVDKFQNERQARKGRIMVEFSSPNASSSGLIFRPVTTLSRKLAIILLVAFSLFYLVAA